MILVRTVQQDNGMDWYGEKSAATEARFSIYMITYGKCVFWVNDDKIVAEKGDLLLIPAGSYFYGKSIPTIFHSKTAITFMITATMPQLPILQSQQYTHTKIGAYELIHERMKQIVYQWEDNAAYREVFASALLLEVLTRWNQELDRGSVSSEKNSSVDTMKKYIQDHHRNKITKHVLADVIGKSPNYAATLFSNVTGQTISEYVHAYRIKTAIYMLSESQLSVAEIAAFLGYSNTAYFYKTFRRVTGRSPSHFSDR